MKDRYHIGPSYQPLGEEPPKRVTSFNIQIHQVAHLDLVRVDDWRAEPGGAAPDPAQGPVRLAGIAERVGELTDRPARACTARPRSTAASRTHPSRRRRTLECSLGPSS